MRAGFRFVASAAAFLMTYVFTWLLWLFVPVPGLQWAGGVVALLAAIVAARWVWGHAATVPDSAWVTAGYGAVLVGAIGLVGGFFGPMLFVPQANQGPLLGLLITGPGGVVLGAVGGFVYGLFRAGRGSR